MEDWRPAPIDAGAHGDQALNPGEQIPERPPQGMMPPGMPGAPRPGGGGPGGGMRPGGPGGFGPGGPGGPGRPPAGPPNRGQGGQPLPQPPAGESPKKDSDTPKKDGDTPKKDGGAKPADKDKSPALVPISYQAPEAKGAAPAKDKPVDANNQAKPTEGKPADKNGAKSTATTSRPGHSPPPNAAPAHFGLRYTGGDALALWIAKRADRIGYPRPPSKIFHEGAIKHIAKTMEEADHPAAHVREVNITDSADGVAYAVCWLNYDAFAWANRQVLPSWAFQFGLDYIDWNPHEALSSFYGGAILKVPFLELFTFGALFILTVFVSLFQEPSRRTRTGHVFAA
jgi:hypothetical protein